MEVSRNARTASVLAMADNFMGFVTRRLCSRCFVCLYQSCTSPAARRHTATLIRPSLDGPPQLRQNVYAKRSVAGPQWTSIIFLKSRDRQLTPVEFSQQLGGGGNVVRR